jgi:hypothetical protein
MYQSIYEKLPTAPSPLRQLTNAAAEYVENHYHMKVIERMLPEGKSGSFDGQTIELHAALDDGYKFFLLLHLFGHNTLLNTDENSIQFIKEVSNPLQSKEALSLFYSYEDQASRYGASVLAEICSDEIKEDLLRIYSHYAEADLRYFLHFCRTGERGRLEDFASPDEVHLEPLAIPDFHAQYRILVETA